MDETIPTPARELAPSGATGLLRRLDVDRPVFFGLLARAWGVGAGPITALLIATRFTADVQGFYYTFATILALKTFVELGLGTVVIQFASHEWSKLAIAEAGTVTGDPDARARLAQILRFATKWYAAGALIAALALGGGGYVFFSTSPAVGADWIAPWFSLCAVTAVTLLLVPIWSVLEGCNQVGPLYAFRFVQGLVGSVSLWLAIAGGAQLWTPAISGLATLVCAAAFLRGRYWNFLQSLLAGNSGHARLAWRDEMWPMQWRIAVSWIGGYFIFSFFVPVLFRFHGPVVAGQMGMTWSIVAIVSAIGDAWLSPRVPRLGMLIAQKNYVELDRQLWRITRVVVSTSASAVFLAWLIVTLLNVAHDGLAARLAARILPPLPVALFLLAQLLYLTTAPFAAYLRAHKREPLMGVSVIFALAVGGATLYLGKYHSVTAVACGYLALNLLMLPTVLVVWSRRRTEWHR